MNGAGQEELPPRPETPENWYGQKPRCGAYSLEWSTRAPVYARGFRTFPGFPWFPGFSWVEPLLWRENKGWLLSASALDRVEPPNGDQGGDVALNGVR